jgi:hypothetical protein
MSVYLHMVPETEVDYSRRGPGAYDALASGKVPNSFRGLPVFTSYPLDTDFNGAPISLLERDRMIGEWFVLPAGEDAIHIFSADADRFVKLTRGDIANAAMNLEDGDGTDQDILVFRPFATWRMASALLLKSGSELGNTFRKYTPKTTCYCPYTHLSHSFLHLPLLLCTQTDTTTCSFRTTPCARLCSVTTRFTVVQ